MYAFDAEMLAFALDGDTVQNVVPVAAERSGMAPREVLNRVGAAVTRGEIRLYIDDDEHAAPNGGADELTPSVLARQVCTWMTCTSHTHTLAQRVKQASRQADV